jgi:hypothetical protein
MLLELIIYCSSFDFEKKIEFFPPPMHQLRDLTIAMTRK